jgi:hypothetical protein
MWLVMKFVRRHASKIVSRIAVDVEVIVDGLTDRLMSDVFHSQQVMKTILLYLVTALWMERTRFLLMLKSAHSELIRLSMAVASK